jgi:hypothetical protein
MDPDSLTQAITATTDDLPKLSEDQRRRLMAACNGLIGAIENPVEATLRIMFGVRRQDLYDPTSFSAG